MPVVHHKDYHPELDHHWDDAHDVEPVPFHEHAILRSPDYPDHHSYGHKVTKKDFKPMPEYEGIHYYDASTYKLHAKSPTTPTSHKDMQPVQKSKSTKKAKAAPASSKPASGKKHTRDVEYLVDGYGHVHTIEHLL